MDRTKRNTAIEANQPYIGRFAPTPSGALHLGSLVAALGSYLDARAHNGRWKLRIDDLDEQRCRPATTDRIITQLSAHGLVPDEEIVRQRSRHESYAEALTKLGDIALTYRCRCTRKQLRDAMQTGQAIEGLAGPIYPGTCRRTRPFGKRNGRKSLYRAARNHRIHRSLSRADSTIITHHHRRPDFAAVGRCFRLHLAEVVDNQAMGITHVVRGADLSPLTPLHIALHHALYPDTPPPVYGHLPLVLGSNGLKLSKTNHAPALDIRRAQGKSIYSGGTSWAENPNSACRH